MAVFVWSPYLLFMTITSIRKNTKKGSASKRYKSQMARNTSDSHETTNRLLSWKKSAKVRKTVIIIIITKRLDKWVDFSAVKELWQRKIFSKHWDQWFSMILKGSVIHHLMDNKIILLVYNLQIDLLLILFHIDMCEWRLKSIV